MEQFSSARDTNRHSNDNRCLLDSLGRLDTRSRGAGVLGQRHVLPSLQLPRTIGHVARSDFLTRIPTKQNSSNLLRQYNNSGLHQSYGRQYQRTGHGNSSNTPASYQYEFKDCGILHIRSKKLASRPIKPIEVDVRMEITPELVSSNRHLLGTTQHRQINVHDERKDTKLQQFILGSAHKRSERVISEGLVILEQLCKCSIQLTSQSPGHKRTTTDSRHHHSYYMASSNMVRKDKSTPNRQSNSSTKFNENTALNRSRRGTAKKQGMASVRLESLWKTCLRCLGWSKRASTQSTLSLTQSTLKTYNSSVNKYVEFCHSKDLDFSDKHNTNVIAYLLCHILDRSDRPESVVKMCSAALTFMFEALGKCSPVHNPDIKRLITRIIKSGTLIPMKRSQPMPTNSFVELFHSWGKNEEMTIKQLRMKTFTLLALVCMTRPSDLALKGVNLSSRDISVHNIVLSLDNIQFMVDNYLTIFFFGIKNDTSRSGFEVNITPNADAFVMDPVSCLRTKFLHR